MTTHLLTADLRRQDNFRVLPCAADTNSIFDCLAEHSPDILLIGTNSREAAVGRLPLLRRIRADHPSTRTIVILSGGGRDLVAELFRAGIKGVFDRADYDLDRLSRCIQCVSVGQVWANSEQLGFLLDVFAGTASLNVVSASGEEILTRREKDVVRLVAEGFSNREIAQQLGLSAHTVKNYLFNIFDKLGISSRAELVMYALSNSDNSLSRSWVENEPLSDKIPVRSCKSGRRAELSISSRAPLLIAR
jgi:DNA-binding NarL/FixJ family response regulator